MSSSATTTLEVGGLHWATSEAVVENVLGRRPGVLDVAANATAQTATVTYDPQQTSVAELARWVRDCGYHCAGRAIPDHVCDPMGEPNGGTTHGAAMPPQQAMGHGGHHADMSMDDLARDMRNRFLVAAVLSVPILLFSPIGRDVLGFEVSAPFGLRDDVLSLVLSLPVIFYAAWIFFDGAWWALRARTGANDAVRTLLELAPPQAVVLREDGTEVEVPTATWPSATCCWCAPAPKWRSTGWSTPACRRWTSPWSPARACRWPSSRVTR